MKHKLSKIALAAALIGMFVNVDMAKSQTLARSIKPPAPSCEALLISHAGEILDINFQQANPDHDTVAQAQAIQKALDDAIKFVNGVPCSSGGNGGGGGGTVVDAKINPTGGSITPTKITKNTVNTILAAPTSPTTAVSVSQEEGSGSGRAVPTLQDLTMQKFIKATADRTRVVLDLMSIANF